MTAEPAQNNADGQQEESDYDRKLRFSRGCRHFIGYINYEWEQDEGWTEFQEKEMKNVTNAKQIEEVKREYYKTRVNSRLDASFVLENEEHK